MCDACAMDAMDMKADTCDGCGISLCGHRTAADSPTSPPLGSGPSPLHRVQGCGAQQV
jgi:hypothetical protein